MCKKHGIVRSYGCHCQMPSNLSTIINRDPLIHLHSTPAKVFVLPVLKAAVVQQAASASVKDLPWQIHPHRNQTKGKYRQLLKKTVRLFKWRLVLCLVIACTCHVKRWHSSCLSEAKSRDGWWMGTTRRSWAGHPLCTASIGQYRTRLAYRANPVNIQKSSIQWRSLMI